jgi:Uma2 family endonuclease
MSIAPSPLTGEPEYAWEIATLHPEQGEWSEEHYLELTDGTNRLIEFTDGRLEFLPMPTEIHQALAGFLYHALLNFVSRHKLGKVPFPPLRVRVRPNKIRQPDVLFLHKDNFRKRHNRVWDGADIVMEVVSPDPKDRVRDYEEKLADYAAGGIPEYWIADPDRELVTIYRLQEGKSALHGEFAPGQQATSALLDGFAVDVTALFAAADDVVE